MQEYWYSNGEYGIQHDNGKDTPMSTYIAKPPKRKGNKNGEEAYKKWRDEVLLPAWWEKAKSRALSVYSHNCVDYLPLPCARCGARGYMAKYGDSFSLAGVCVGHLTGRGREPKLKMDISNVEAQCFKCNGSLDRGMKKIDNADKV